MQKKSKEKKIIELLRYLKYNSDPNHPVSLPMISEHFGRPDRLPSGYLPPYDYFGDKNTRNSLIKNLTYAINSDKNGNLLPESEWKIVYNDFKRDYGSDSTSESKRAHHICDIYYNHDFSYDEIDIIIKSLKKNEELSDDERSKMIDKITHTLTSRFYGNRTYISTKVRRELEIRRK